jgi:hypothetical protein
MKGSTVCAAHGGCAPQVRKALQEHLEREQAELAIAAYGLPREVDPATAFFEKLWRTAGHVAWLRAKVSELGFTCPSADRSGTR